MRSPEITLESEFGQDIIKYLEICSIKKVIEIGSGSGNGSTQCFLKYFDQLNSDEKELHCFEPVKSWFSDLEKNINDRKYCKLHNYSPISYEDLLVKNFKNDFYDYEYNKLKNQYDEKILKSWYDQDLPYFKEINFSILEKIDAEAVLIDGCEFSGYSEYKKLHPSTRLIFLDDCLTAFKTNQVYAELLKNSNWELLVVNGERNGYSIFRKKQ